MDKFTAEFMMFIIAVNTCHENSPGWFLLLGYVLLRIANALYESNDGDDNNNKTADIEMAVNNEINK